MTDREMRAAAVGRGFLRRQEWAGGEAQCGGGGAAGTIGAWTIAGARSGRRTPHLASPLEGGRDVLGKEGERDWVGGWGWCAGGGVGVTCGVG